MRVAEEVMIMMYEREPLCFEKSVAEKVGLEVLLLDVEKLPFAYAHVFPLSLRLPSSSQLPSLLPFPVPVGSLSL